MKDYRNILLGLYNLKIKIEKGQDKETLLFELERITNNIESNIKSEEKHLKYLLEDINNYNNIIELINNYKGV